MESCPAPASFYRGSDVSNMPPFRHPWLDAGLALAQHSIAYRMNRHEHKSGIVPTFIDTVFHNFRYATKILKKRDFFRYFGFLPS
jgi:hypothetical protein